VIGEVEEDLGVGIRFKNLSSSSSLISLKDSKESFGGDFLTFVVKVTILVDIPSRSSSRGGLVEKLSGIRVLR
jgi:hypothetical protein